MAPALTLRASAAPQGSFGAAPRALNPASCTKRSSPDCALKASRMYSEALQLSRQEDFPAARVAFEQTVAACPCWPKPWVSYAQMEKRAGRLAAEERWRRCRQVLQRGLLQNPSSPQIIQAWGLMELQRGNLVPAVRLLERCVSFDPARCEPLLRWKPVRDARQTVGPRRRPAAGDGAAGEQRGEGA